MTRPVCPKCHRPSVVVNSHPSGEWRIQYFGCRECRLWSLGSNLVAAIEKRTRSVRSMIRRNDSGRFVTSR